MAPPSDEAPSDASASDPSVGDGNSAPGKRGTSATVSRRASERSGAASSPSVTTPGPRTAVVPAPVPGTDSTPKEARWQREASSTAGSSSTKAPAKGKAPEKGKTPENEKAPAKGTASKGSASKGRNGRGGGPTPKIKPAAPAKDSTSDDERPAGSSGNGSTKSADSKQDKAQQDKAKQDKAKPGTPKQPDATKDEGKPSAAKRPSAAASKRRSVLQPPSDAVKSDSPSKPAGTAEPEAAKPDRAAKPDQAAKPDEAAGPAWATDAEPSEPDLSAARTSPAPAVAPAPAAPVVEPPSTQRVVVAAPPTAVQPVQPASAGEASEDVADGSTVVESRSRLGRRERFRARRVRRLVRHVDPWSVFKLTLVLNVCLWFIFLVAGITMWSVARSSGTIENFEKFIAQSFSLTAVEIDADLLFRVYSLIGLIISLALTGAAVIGSILFNLISDLIGGVWVSVIEEETAEPV